MLEMLSWCIFSLSMFFLAEQFMKKLSVRNLIYLLVNTNKMHTINISTHVEKCHFSLDVVCVTYAHCSTVMDSDADVQSYLMMKGSCMDTYNGRLTSNLSKHFNNFKNSKYACNSGILFIIKWLSALVRNLLSNQWSNQVVLLDHLSSRKKWNTTKIYFLESRHVQTNLIKFLG